MRWLMVFAALVALDASAGEDVTLVVLGIAQDAGYPQAGCYRPHCLRAWNEPANKRHASSIAVVDKVGGGKFLFDATPDMREQLHVLHSIAPDDTVPLGGVFLTHGHMGHYTGLVHFGREAMGTDVVPVYAMPRMRDYLGSNGPWDQLVRLGNIALRPIEDSESVRLSAALNVTPFLVPHRDEYTETVGYRIDGPNASAVFIPDIDKWEAWDVDIRDVVAEVDYALLDASFFADGELGNRDMSEIPHPFVSETMALFDALPESERAKILFIHMNHTNPLLIDGSDAQREVRSRGYRIASEGMQIPL